MFVIHLHFMTHLLQRLFIGHGIPLLQKRVPTAYKIKLCPVLSTKINVQWLQNRNT